MKKLDFVVWMGASILLAACNANPTTPGAGLDASRIGVPVSVGLPTLSPGASFIVTSTPSPNTPTPLQTARSAAPIAPQVAEKANQVVKALKNKDFAAIGALAHPTRGVCFSPTVQMQRNSVCLNGNLLAGYLDGNTRTQSFNWGSAQGAPVRLNFGNYFDRYLNSRDFAGNAAVLTPNPREARGPIKSNIARFYPGCAAVEYYVAGTGPNDWRSVTVVFQPYQGSWRLIAIVSDEA